jgi:hypothetical protein
MSSKKRLFATPQKTNGSPQKYCEPPLLSNLILAKTLPCQEELFFNQTHANDEDYARISTS